MLKSYCDHDMILYIVLYVVIDLGVVICQDIRILPENWLKWIWNLIEICNKWLNLVIKEDIYEVQLRRFKNWEIYHESQYSLQMILIYYYDTFKCLIAKTLKQ